VEPVFVNSPVAAPAPSLNLEGIFSKIAPDGQLQISNGPVHLPKELVLVDRKSQMAVLTAEFEGRLRKLILLPGEALALRPEKDFVATIAEDFELLPSTSFDLAAIRSQIDRVLADEERTVGAIQAELAELSAKERELLTGPATPDEVKSMERLGAFKLAAPQGLKELEELRKKAAAVPKDIRQVGNFSLFLCQKEGSREIIRFDEEPELVRIASP
jgi:hypothetical protein